MTAELRHSLRKALLLIARSAPLGLTIESARVMLGGFALQPTTGEIRDEIAYLVDKGLLAPVEKKISPELKAWRVTADGRDYLAEEGHE